MQGKINPTCLIVLAKSTNPYICLTEGFEGYFSDSLFETRPRTSIESCLGGLFKLEFCGGIGNNLN